uniref:Thiaminase-2/PQQC domain-containing protein n=2 Tax=Manihot esculenta TaxID=3983 RepID=A0A2C9VCD6_MANES
MAIPPKLTSFSSSSSTMAAARSLEEGLASRYWLKFRRETIFVMYTPFVVSLAAGNLKIESFRHFLAQDSYFLKAFAHACELAEECADDDDAKLAITKLRKGVLQGLKRHNSFVQEWGIDPSKDGTINSATVKYTDFLLATASGKIEGVTDPGKLVTPFERTKLPAYTLGALTPCVRLYAFLAKELLTHANSGDGSHPYKKWFASYSSEGFQAAALQTEDLLDKLSVPLTGEELDIIEKLYHQAMKLEIEFFNLQPLAQPTVVPLIKEHNPVEDRLVIFSDFDLTCTIVDSSAILAEIAIVTVPKADQAQSETQIARMSSAELRNSWNGISTQYTEEYEQCIESILPSAKGEFNYEVLCKAIEQISDFERRANARVIESGLLKGLNLEDIKRAGELLVLQNGCASFFQKIVKNENLNANIHIISYCWCADLIRSSFSSGGLDVLNIHANELSFEGSICTGEIIRKVESPVDKVEAFHNILKSYNTDKKNLTVYIGDTIGDLLCLLQADVGIVIGSSPSLRRVGGHFGVSFLPLFPSLIKKQKQYTDESSSKWKGQSGTLYTVTTWAEIQAFISGWVIHFAGWIIL